MVPLLEEFKVTRHFIYDIGWSWPYPKDCPGAWGYLSTPSILDQADSQPQALGLSQQLHQSLLIGSFQDHFRLPTIFPLLQELGVPFVDLLVGGDSGVGALRRHFALAHFQVVADDQHQFELPGLSHDVGLAPRAVGGLWRCSSSRFPAEPPADAPAQAHPAHHADDDVQELGLEDRNHGGFWGLPLKGGKGRIYLGVSQMLLRAFRVLSPSFHVVI